MVPGKETLMVCLADVAVKRNHTSLVVAAVAPPQAPAGAVASGPALCKLPVTLLQVADGVSCVALEQLACACTKAGSFRISKAISRVRI